MKINLEIFFTTLKKDEVLYEKETTDVSEKAQDPDSLVHEVIKKNYPSLELKNCIVHSTSWRFVEPDALFFTYIVYSDHAALKSPIKLSLDDLSIASGGIDKPRPENLDEKAIISHAMRHLSFLLKTDPFRGRVSKETSEEFDEISTSLGGRI